MQEVGMLVKLVIRTTGFDPSAQFVESARDSARLRPSGAGQLNGEAAAIVLSGTALDEPFCLEPVDHAGQGRAAVEEDAVQRVYRRGAVLGEMCEDQRLRLRHRACRSRVEEEAQRVHCAMELDHVIAAPRWHADRFASISAKALTVLRNRTIRKRMKAAYAALAGALLILTPGGPTGAGSDATPSASAVLTLQLAGPADAAFVMFDPVHESLWSPHWQPRFLGEPSVATGLVFVTVEHAGMQTVWLLDRYDPAARSMRYVNVTGGRTLTQLDITVVPRGPAASEATLRRVETALDPAAADEVRALARDFPAQAPHWESAINDALRRSR
jgi:hypothetical protein